MAVRQLSEEQNLSAVAAAWNTALPRDCLTEKRFRAVMLGDPNYEPEGMMVAKDDDGSVLGFAACVLRRTVEGKDGGGRDGEFPWAFLKGFFVVEGEEGEAAADGLLAAVESYAAAAGKELMRVTEYSAGYVYPGMDVHYERLCEALSARGYRDVRTIEDVGVDLRQPELPALLERARKRAGPGVEMLTWRPELLPAMRDFVAEGDQAQWFPVGWEKRFSQPRERALVLKRGSEIVGWAEYWPGRPQAGFGPTLVLERERGKGYGSFLLRECMLRARDGGAQYMDAGWANTGFYTRNGWRVVRRYAVFTKELHAGAR